MRILPWLSLLAAFGALALHAPASAQNNARSATPALPWTADQERAYVVEGLELGYELKGRTEKSQEVKCSVVLTDDDGFECSITSGDSAGRQGQGGWDDDLGGNKLKVNWGALAELIKDATVGTKKLKIGKQQVDTVTYTSYRSENNKRRASVVYVAKEFPGVLLKRERWTETGRGQSAERSDITLTSVRHPENRLDELKEKLPFSDEACQKFFVKGMVLNYSFVDDLKLGGKGGDGTIKSVPYDLEVLEVSKTGYVAKVPTSWPEGRPADYQKVAIDWGRSLDELAELLDDVTVSEGRFTVGEKTLATVTFKGSRTAGDFTDTLSLTFAKDYPGVLLAKEKWNTDNTSGARRLTRMTLTSLRKP